MEKARSGSNGPAFSAGLRLLESGIEWVTPLIGGPVMPSPGGMSPFEAPLKHPAMFSSVVCFGCQVTGKIQALIGLRASIWAKGYVVVDACIR